MPPYVSSAWLQNSVGSHCICPWCRRTSTRDKKALWIKTPLARRDAHWVCTGCALDLYGVCANGYDEDNPYFDIVEGMAEIEGVDVRDFIIECMQHQCELIQNDDSLHRRPEYRQLLAQLEVHIKNART